MRSYKKFFSILFLLFLLTNLNAQVYHYITGEIIPNAKDGDLFTKKGVFSGYEAELSTFIVHENRRKPSSKLINIPVIKILSYNNVVSDPIFLLSGGPGASNIWKRNFPEYLLEDHDIIMMGYRGVDGSEVLSCPIIHDLVKSKGIFNPENIGELYNAWYLEAEDFRLNNIDIDAYDMYEVVRDIESLRISMGYKNINFYAFSYGTMLTQLYLQYFAEHVNKMVLIGTRPYGFYLHDPHLIENKIKELYTDLLINNIISNDSISISFLIDSLFNNEEIFSHIDNFELTKFKISLFQKLFNYNSSKYLIEALIDCYNDNYDKINHINNGFKLYFNNDITLGDYALKTNCSAGISIDTAYYFPKNTINKKTGHFLTEGINTWFLSFNICRSNLFISYKPKTILNETLFISGEYDFIAPLELVEEDLLPYFTNNEYIILPYTGHEDLIENKNDSLETKIYNFFNF